MNHFVGWSLDSNCWCSSQSLYRRRSSAHTDDRHPDEAITSVLGAIHQQCYSAQAIHQINLSRL